MMPTLRVAMIVGLVAFVSAVPSPLNTDDRLAKLDSRIKHMQMEIGLYAAHGKDSTKATKAVAQALPKTVHKKDSAECAQSCLDSEDTCTAACLIDPLTIEECAALCETAWAACSVACEICIPWVTC